MNKLTWGKNSKKNNRKQVSLLLVIILLMTLFMPGTYQKVYAADNSAELAVKAVRNNYQLYENGTLVNGAYDAYILTKAGADLSTWTRNGTNFKAEVLSLIDNTIANPSAVNAKEIAGEYLAAKQWGENTRAAALLDIIKSRQLAHNGAIDANPFGNVAAYDLLGRAGEMNAIYTQSAISYLLNLQDSNTKAWTSTWNDFQCSNQGLRALEYLIQYADTATGNDIQTAIDSGLTWIKNLQGADGGFNNGAWDDTLIDTAEVISTLNLLNIDPVNWKKSDSYKSALDYMKDQANILNSDGTLGGVPGINNGSGNLADNTWALDAYLTMGVTIPTDTAIALNVTPQTAEIEKDQTQQFSASLYKFSGDSQDVTGLAQWTTTNAAIAPINNSGLATGGSIGTVRIGAEYGGLTGSSILQVNSAGVSGGDAEEDSITVTVKVTGENKETLFNHTVELSASSQWGQTALGALDATGLDYSDRDGFVTSIEGQENSGVHGWMYKVNGSAPSIGANEKAVSDGDMVTWYYSGSNNYTGDTASTNSDVIAKEDIKTADDQKLSDALAETGKAVLSLIGDPDSKVQVSAANILAISSQNMKFSLSSTDAVVDFPPKALSVTELSDNKSSKLELGISEVAQAEKAQILSGLKGNSGFIEIGGKILSLTVQLVTPKQDGSTETKTIESFGEPVCITIDLSHSNLTDEEIKNLTGVRYEKTSDGSYIPVKLGGSYDKSVKTFKFYTNHFSLYSVLKATALNQLSLTIGQKDININGTSKAIDAAPQIINNRTMVPIRFIAEGLGAKVDWISKSKTVTIKLGEKTVSMVPPIIIDGRTFVPVRYVSETFGAQVLWFPTTKTVQIVR